MCSTRARRSRRDAHLRRHRPRRRTPCATRLPRRTSRFVRAGSAARHRRRGARRARRAAATTASRSSPIGDCPLVAAATLARPARASRPAGSLAVLTARVSDPAGLGPHRARRRGRGARDRRGQGREPGRSARSTRSTPACMAAPTALLRRWVAALDDRQRAARVLPDRRRRAGGGRRRAGRRRTSPPTRRDVLGVNDRAQLAAVERIVQRRQADALLRGRHCARRSRAHRHSRHARLRPRRRDRRRLRVRRRRCARRRRRRSAPYCVLRDVDGRRGHEDRAVLAPRRADDRRELPGRPVRAAAAGRRRSPTTCTSATSSRSRRARSGAARRPTTSPTSATRRSARASTIGAGSITANYDGANKHRTVIERRRVASARTACWSRRSRSARRDDRRAAARSRRTRRRTR